MSSRITNTYIRRVNPLVKRKQKTQIPPNIQTAQEFISVSDIKDSILYTRNGYMFGYIRVNSQNDKLIPHSEKEFFFNGIAIALSVETKPYQIISLPKTIDIVSILDNLQTLRATAENDAKLELINAEIEYTKRMVMEDKKEPIIFIKIWDKLGKGVSAKSFSKRLNDLASALRSNKVQAEIIDNAGIANICKIFSELNVYQFDSDEGTQPLSPVAKKSKDKKSTEIAVNYDLLNMITPIGGISFNLSSTIIGSTVGKLYCASKFPSSGFDYNWLTEIMNCTEAVTCLTFTTGNAMELGDNISKTMHRQMADVSLEGDPRRRRQIVKNIDDGDRVLEEIDEKNETVGFFSIVTMPYTDDMAKLDEVCAKVENIYRKQRISLRCLGNLQKEALKHISPYFPNQKLIDLIANRVMLLTTVTGGSPMLINSFKDERGIYFAKTIDGNVVMLDFGIREENRPNANVFICGKSGMGKSATMKSIMQMLYIQGYKLLIIDPDSEYKELTEKLGGSCLNAGGGHAKINIFEFRPDARRNEVDSVGDGFVADDAPDLSVHMKFLDCFFRLYCSGFSELQYALLQDAIIETYRKKNITWETETSSLASTDFPIMEDLYACMLERSESDPRFRDMADIFKDITYGGDSFLWNGYTNIETENQVICFDTNRLNNASDKIRSAQYYNVLEFCWSLASRLRSERVAIILDEAHLLVDERVPETLNKLSQYSKRIRKYEGLMIVGTQQVLDFIGESVKQHGQALIDNATYKLLFGVDAKNLKDTSDTFMLTEPEENILRSTVRRKAVGIFGNQHLELIFDLPQSRLDMMGTRGGR